MINERYKKELIEVILTIKNTKVLAKFFEELLTPREFKDITKRWQTVKQLHKKIPQRQISKNLRVSISKITRGSRVLQSENSIFKKILKNLKN
ncbi:MAG: Trp family transcriptional regulator [Patescibacteria group bacterium]